MSGLSIKNIILLFSKFSKSCSTLISSLDDKTKEWINFIQVDTQSIRNELIYRGIKEVPTCIIITVDNSIVIYKGLERIKNFFDSLEKKEEEKYVKEERVKDVKEERVKDERVKDERVKDDVPSEAKKYKKEKVNLAEVLNTGAKMLEENEKKRNERPQMIDGGTVIQ